MLTTHFFPHFLLQSISTDPESTSDLDDVLFHTNYGVRTIELNRPHTHNALTLSMAERILERLQVTLLPQTPNPFYADHNVT